MTWTSGWPIPRYRYRYRPIPHGIGIGRYCVVSVADTDTPKKPDFWLSDCFRTEVVVKKFVEKYLNDSDFSRFQVRIESIFKYVVKTLCWRYNDRLLRAIFRLVSVSVPVSVSADTREYRYRYRPILKSGYRSTTNVYSLSLQLEVKIIKLEYRLESIK